MILLKSNHCWRLIPHSVETLDFVILKRLVLLLSVLNKTHHRPSTVLKEPIEIMIADSLEVSCILSDQRPCIYLPSVPLVICT
jgi:hypothetical protein